jgi:tol-pal system protein YbgF
MSHGSRLAAACCLASALAGVACVMPDHMATAQKDVADVQQQLQAITREQASLAAKVQQLELGGGSEAETSLSREELAELTHRLDQVSRETSVAGERMTDIDRRIDSLNEEMQQMRELLRARGEAARPGTGTGAVVPPPAVPSEASAPGPQGGTAAVPDAELLYNTSYADFSKGNYGLAIAGFEEYLERFPQSPLADNALYWIGECHFSQGSFTEAVRTFDRLLADYAKSEKAAAANLKKALAFLEQNQVGQAIVQLRYVVSSYPGTDEARIARDKLTSLGAPT